MKTGFKPMRTICKGCGKTNPVDMWMVKFKRCRNCCYIKERMAKIRRDDKRKWDEKLA